MQRIVPDKIWWEKECNNRNASSICPYASSHRCPRYYDSIVLLSRSNMIAGMAPEKEKELNEFWERTNFSSLCDEEVPAVTTKEFGGLSSVSNFCPEVSFKYLSYYADHMHKYVDDIDQDTGRRIAEKDNLENDWKYTWMSVEPKFYLDCDVFESVKKFNEKLGNDYLKRLHPNIVQQINRMNNCLDTNDPAGALHAASNILETMAKEITQNPNVSNEPLGGFFKQFEKMSKLPQNLIEAIKDIYNLRNKLPTAGHGSLNKPELTMVEAITIAAMTKAILEIEYRSKAI
ncbi:hypothetical protein [Salmonella enterica]|uniref:hypothetical protein n=1 Tax=Salmonella enterica TaxID=28901 RepID=UPI00217E5592|nr:hypothetical protein [Salmonella enterica]